MLSYCLLVACLVLYAQARYSSEFSKQLAAFGDTTSSSSSTTTSSTSDSDSTDSRIASAVEAALRAAHAEKPAARPKTAIPYEKYRLRLSTLNKANSCNFFSCASEIVPTCPTGFETNAAHLQGAIATVTTPRGEFDACFDAFGVAEQLNDRVAFTVTFDGCRGFTLSTVLGERGVNVTALTISTQPPGDGVNGNVYFDPIGDASTFTQANGDNELKHPTVNVVPGNSKIGCDATFDGASRQGVTSFTVKPLTGFNNFVPFDGDFPERFPHLVRNITNRDRANPAQAGTGDQLTFSFSIQQSWVVTDANGPQIREIGLEKLPCATRPRVIYDEITIATMRSTNVGKADPMMHPLLYDALLAGTASANPSFDNFIFQLQVAAGRTQVRLRDVTLDSGAFSDLSHNSKFTPCFRVWRDPDFLIDVFIGMRNGGGEYVRLTLDKDSLPSLVQQVDVVNGRPVYDFFDITDVAEANLPQFRVNEVAFGDLRSRDDDAPVRPFELIRSDVSVVLEKCPSFSYFQ